MAKTTCSVPDCSKPAKSRGWCSMHYERHRLFGTLDRPNPPRPVWDRFWEKVDASGDCWEWTGAKAMGGYGKISVDGRQTPAHRVAWEFLVGPILDGLEIDHLCRNPSCVNPDHLEPVTHLENMRRAKGMGRWQLRKTQCPQGHKYVPENIYSPPSRPTARHCRACQLERQSEGRTT